MNLAQFEWIKTEWKWAFYEHYKISGKLVNIRKRILNQAEAVYVFNTAKRIS